jgi:hypothetical protein
MTEKFDGDRGVWNPELKEMYLLSFPSVNLAKLVLIFLVQIFKSKQRNTNY